MVTGLGLPGLATIVIETVRARAATIKFGRYRVTDDGRAALEAEA
jgi:hypothetical protein